MYIQWLEWLNGEALTKKAGPEWKGGLLLKYSRIISMSDYLRGLWFSLQKPSTQKGDGKGGEVTWQSTAVDSLASIRKNYDVIVIASGAGIRTFPELKQLEVEFVKGKTLIMEDEQDGSSGPLGSVGINTCRPPLSSRRSSCALLDWIPWSARLTIYLPINLLPSPYIGIVMW